MGSFKITNLSTPTEDTDAVTKAYVDGKTDVFKIRYSYARIIKNYKPTFRLSSKFPFGLDEGKLTIQDLTDTGLTITGGAVTKNLSISANITLRSTAIYGTEFTFLLKQNAHQKWAESLLHLLQINFLGGGIFIPSVYRWMVISMASPQIELIIIIIIICVYLRNENQSIQKLDI